MSIMEVYAVRSASFTIGMAALLLSGVAWAEARKAFPQATLILRSTKDGTIQVLDSEGRVQEAYAPGSLSVPAPSPAVLERMKVRREKREKRAKERAGQFAQERGKEARAAQEAAQKRIEAEKARKAAGEKGALRAAAVRLQDPRTGEYLMVVPERRLAGKAKSRGRSGAGRQDKPAGRGNARRFYDQWSGLYLKATPLDQLIEKVEAGK